MNPDAITVEEVDSSAVLPLRTDVLRPHFEAGRLAHFPGDELKTTRHFLARHHQDVVAVLSYFGEALPDSTVSHHWQAIRLRGMAVAPDYQGQGLGSHLLATTSARLPLIYPGAHWLWCNARLGVLDFYRRLGFETFGEPFDVADIGPHQRMRKPLPPALA